MKNSEKLNLAYAQMTGKKVCICTPDYVSLIKNGGIGTSFHHTATSLVKIGADVTVLYANSIDHEKPLDIQKSKDNLAQEGIHLEYLFEHGQYEKAKSTYHPQDIFTISSYCSYRWLKERQFDIVIFPDWRGLGFYSAFAKSQGLAFGRTALWIQAHSSMLWHAMNNQASHYSEQDLRAFQMERKAIELCDVLAVPTQYLLNWMRAHGFRPSGQVLLLPLIINDALLTDFQARPDIANNMPGVPLEFVFFGRLEKRKGLHVFLHALRRLKVALDASGQTANFTVTFLGKITYVDNLSSLTFIDEEMRKIGLPYCLNPSLSSDDALAYLKSGGGIAVIPSLADNSPMTVIECMRAGIPFIASRTGGIPEIVNPKDQATVLFDPDPISLADKLLEIMEGSRPQAMPSVNQIRNIQSWTTSLLSSIPGDSHPAQAIAPIDAKLSICLTHYERPTLLEKTLEGLAQQTFSNFEVIIVDDGSKSTAAITFLRTLHDRFPSLNTRVLHQQNRYVGAARNRALAEATGEYVIFMDDDNYAHPRQVETFIRAITHSGYDALSCVAVAFSEDDDPQDLKAPLHSFLPLGGGKSINLLSNSYGDANGIYRMSALKAVGGYTEDYGLSWEDYELFSRLEQEGFKVGVTPEPLMYLRHAVGTVSRSGSMLGNYYRALRPALEKLPWETYGDIILYALNGSLASNQNTVFGLSSEAASEARMVQSSEDSLSITRLIIRKWLAEGNEAAALCHLEFQISSSKSLHPAFLDLILMKLSLSGAAAFDSLQTLLSHEDAKPFIEALHRICLGEASTSLSSTLMTIAPAAGHNYSIAYIQGLMHLATGNIAEGIAVWATMLRKEEIDYLAAYADLQEALQRKQLRSGLGHFLQHGQQEGRTLSYDAPPYMLISGRTHAVENYETRMAAMAQTEARHAEPLANQLMADIIRSGAVAEAADFARLAIAKRLVSRLHVHNLNMMLQNYLQGVNTLVEEQGEKTSINAVNRVRQTVEKLISAVSKGH